MSFFFLILVFVSLFASKRSLPFVSFLLLSSFSLSFKKSNLTVRQQKLEHPPTDRRAGVAVVVVVGIPGFEKGRFGL